MKTKQTSWLIMAAALLLSVAACAPHRTCLDQKYQSEMSPKYSEPLPSPSDALAKALPAQAHITPTTSHHSYTAQQTLPAANLRVLQYMPDTSTSLGTESLLSEISKEVAGKVYYELKEEGEKNFNSSIAVVAAVPLADLKKETEFGRVLAEFLLTDIADRGLKVTELRLGKDINILPHTGEFIMSRNIGELATDLPELNFVVMSTFTNTRKTLIVQGRLVDLKTGLVKTSWRYNMPLNRELLGLFQMAQQPHTIAVKGIRK